MTQKKKLQGLISRIENEAEEKIKKIESSFEKKKEELEKEFEEKKKSHIENERNKYRSQGELEKTKMISEARLKARKDILSRKRETIENVFDRVLEKIQDLDRKDFRNFVRRLLKQMVSTGQESIVPAEGSDIFTEAFIKKTNREEDWNLKLKEPDSKLQGWFMVKGENYNALASAEALKEHLKELHESRVVEELFPKR